MRRARNGGATLAECLILAGALAAFITLIGTSDLENYDHSFLSLDRGTGFDTLNVLGRPVFTLALGLGVRLPLHGGLQASPAAVLAPYLPEPVTYWLLLTLAMGAAALVVRYAIEPLCGWVSSALATCLLFWSLPIVNYTITDDWPETALTYCAFVVCIFAPHALVELRTGPADATRRGIAGVSILGLLWSALVASHAGYWPLLAVTLLLSAALVAIRTDHPLRSRLTIIAIVGSVSCVAIAAIAPDVVRDMSVAGDALATMRRPTRGPEGSLWSANSPFIVDGSARRTFMFLGMTASALVIGLGCESRSRRRLTVASAIAACACGAVATTLSTQGQRWAPSVLSALRDPAIGFAVLSAACAAGTLQANRVARAIGPRTAAALLLLTGLQGPIVATAAVFERMELQDLFDGRVAPRGTTPPRERIAQRGLVADRVATGSRIALWPGAAATMRNQRRSQADYVDAGHVLLTATLKQRTMVRLFEPNDVLFEQWTYMPAEVLCSGPAVQFLQVDYLLAPAPVPCDEWTPMNPSLIVDEWLTVHTPSTPLDRRVRALPASGLSDALRHERALGGRSSLVSALSPLEGSSLTIGARDVVIHQDAPSASTGRVIVLPLAFDSAWTTSSGRLDDVAGLVALTGANQQDVIVRFAPDAVAVARSLATTAAQILSCLGLIGLAIVRTPAQGPPEGGHHGSN
jgi:hypothetical protein